MTNRHPVMALAYDTLRYPDKKSTTRLPIIIGPPATNTPPLQDKTLQFLQKKPALLIALASTTSEAMALKNSIKEQLTRENIKRPVGWLCYDELNKLSPQNYKNALICLKDTVTQANEQHLLNEIATNIRPNRERDAKEKPGRTLDEDHDLVRSL